MVAVLLILVASVASFFAPGLMPTDEAETVAGYGSAGAFLLSTFTPLRDLATTQRPCCQRLRQAVALVAVSLVGALFRAAAIGILQGTPYYETVVGRYACHARRPAWQDLSHGPEETPPAVDDFNIPLGIFGLHDERFWGGLGRTVALAALLEDRLMSLLQAVTASPQGTFAKKSGTEVIQLLGAKVEDLEGWQDVEIYLSHCTAALKRRHEFTHGLWPAQPEGTALFTHRMDRRGKRAIATVTYEQLQQGIDELVSLVLEWQRWFSLAPSITRPRRKLS